MPKARTVPDDYDPRTPLPDTRWEKFAIEYVTSRPENKPASKCALAAGYSEKTCRKQGMNLLRRQPVLDRILALQQGLAEREAEAAVMDLAERKKLLTDIARGQVVDEFQAIDKEGGKHNLTSKMVKPRIAAVQELNKLDGAYAPEKLQLFGGAVFEFVVTDNKGKVIDIGGDDGK